MSSLACLVLSTSLAYFIAQLQTRCATKTAPTSSPEASELVFDLDLGFQLKQDYEIGVEANNASSDSASRDSLVRHFASLLLMLADRRLEIEPSMADVEEFLRQHCDLDDDFIAGLWISMISQE